MQLDLVFVHSLHSKAQQHPLTSVLHTLGALKKVCIKRKMLSVEIILSAHAHTLDSLSLSLSHTRTGTSTQEHTDYTHFKENKID